jgi:hypothetical protein
MTKLLVAFFFAFSTIAQAEAPPVSIKGNKESVATTAWNLQLPFFQGTTTAGITRRIETGNANRLQNPSFEASNPLLGWTKTSSGTFAVSSFPVDGANSYDLNYSAVNGAVIEQSVAITANEAASLQTINFEASMYVGTLSSVLQLCALVSGVEKNCVAVPKTSSLAGLQKVTTYFQVTSVDTTMGVRLKTTTSDSASLRVDAAYVGVANIGVGSPDSVDAAYVPTLSGATLSASECYWARNNDKMNIRCKITTSAAAGSELQIGLPSGYTSTAIPSIAVVGHGNVAFSNGTDFSGRSILIEPSKTYMTVGLENSSGNGLTKSVGSSAIGAGTFSFTASVPISGWTAQTAIPTQNSNYDWTSYTPTTQGFGSVTFQLCQHKREGPLLLGRCLINTGTVTTTEAQIGLPSGLTTSSLYPSLPAGAGTAMVIPGSYATNSTNAATYTMLAKPSVAYVNFGYANGTTSGMAWRNGNDFAVSNGQLSVNWTVQIQGWSENQNAPQLVGSVVAPSATSVIRTESVVFGGSTIPSVCTVSPCTIYTGTNGVSSVTRSGGGTYVVNFSSAWPTSWPPCTFQGSNLANSGMTVSIYQTTSTSITIYTTGGAGLIDELVTMTCIGPK